MIRLFCILNDSAGLPMDALLMRRKYANLQRATNERNRLLGRGWDRVVPICADDPLIVQFAEWASRLLPLNPRYVLDPQDLASYIRGPNWNSPGVEYAHYEEYVKGIGKELWSEFSLYRKSSLHEAYRRIRWMLGQVGLTNNENE